jgi:hypothetical protein
VDREIMASQLRLQVCGLPGRRTVPPAHGRITSGDSQTSHVARPRYEPASARSAESTTISGRVLFTIASSSACSAPGTLNLSSVC